MATAELLHATAPVEALLTCGSKKGVKMWILPGKNGDYSGLMKEF